MRYKNKTICFNMQSNLKLFVKYFYNESFGFNKENLPKYNF